MGHQGEARDIRVLAGLSNVGCIKDSKRSQSNALPGQRYLGGRGFGHVTSLVESFIGVRTSSLSSGN